MLPMRKDVQPYMEYKLILPKHILVVVVDKKNAPI
nr:MAG TPA: hypothetical protein [Crassvirales sp.]